MTWVKLDDQFPYHPKVIAAGGDAAWLYVSGLCYCQAQLTAGVIPAGLVKRLTDRKTPMKLAAKLVEVGLWEPVEGGYRVHDFDEYNEEAERVKHRRELARERAARWRREHSGNGVTDDVRTQGVTAYAMRDVTRDECVSNAERNERKKEKFDQKKERNSASTTDTTEIDTRAQDHTDLRKLVEDHEFFSQMLDPALFVHQMREMFPELDLVIEAKKAAVWLQGNCTPASPWGFLQSWFQRADNDRMARPKFGGTGAIQPRTGFMTAGEKTAEASRELMRRAEERERRMAAGEKA